MIKSESFVHFLKKKSTIIILFGLGFLFMISTTIMPNQVEQASMFSTDSQNKKEEQDWNDVQKYEDFYEEKLQRTLEEIAGVSDVTVLITLEAMDTQVVEKNKKEKTQKTIETDQKGGKREIEDHSIDDEIVVEKTNGEERPFIIREDQPKVRGVLIVAKGVENPKTKTMVIEAVSRTLNVGSHRISVLPKEK